MKEGHSYLKVILKEEVEGSWRLASLHLNIQHRHIDTSSEGRSCFPGVGDLQKPECLICHAKNNYCLPSQQESRSSWIQQFQMSDWTLHYLYRSRCSSHGERFNLLPSWPRGGPGMREPVWGRHISLSRSSSKTGAPHMVLWASSASVLLTG